MLKYNIPSSSVIFKYIRECVEVLFNNEDEHCSIVKDVYSTVAKQNRTTICCIESSIRKGLVKLCQDPNLELKKLMESSSGVKAGVISNSRFLHLVHDIIKLEYSHFTDF